MSSQVVRSRVGFTLIEVLVVCAILALLGTLVLSVFSRVKTNARRTVCISNLRQIGLATQMYVTDTGRYPNPRYEIAQINCSWAERLLKYTQNTSVFECPDGVKTSYMPGCTADPDPREDNEFMLPVNLDGGYDINDFSTSRFLGNASFRNPADSIFILDGSGRFISVVDRDLSKAEEFEKCGIHTRHQQGSNTLFIDGHVKWMSRQNLANSNLWMLNYRPKPTTP